MSFRFIPKSLTFLNGIERRNGFYFAVEILGNISAPFGTLAIR